MIKCEHWSQINKGTHMPASSIILSLWTLSDCPSFLSLNFFLWKNKNGAYITRSLSDSACHVVDTH